jgi:DNA repair and recombination protein RAD54B
MPVPAATEIASTLQSASLNRHPSPTRDMNPTSQLAGAREPVTLTNPDDDDDEAADGLDERAPSIATDEVPLSAIRPLPRTQNLPPLPDLRFEQSYLRSLEGTKGWTGVAYVTIRDQVGALLLLRWFFGCKNGMS